MALIILLREATQIGCIIKQVILILTKTIISAKTCNFPAYLGKNSQTFFLFLFIIVKVILWSTFSHTTAFRAIFWPLRPLPFKVVNLGALLELKFVASFTATLLWTLLWSTFWRFQKLQTCYLTIPYLFAHSSKWLCIEALITATLSISLVLF